ncbi:MAG: SRPBCC family protein [Brevundimonas sp.]|uniref:SRPBCC family protein n=1 Tax=Brevundimonas sp. TaxID=1871086 RepID=UPI0027282E82|nr:SRPBCC family protein [Brevundimonas sp.]MDO9589370.1 SRPBCC family protein [Brevundimonas sp.]MDP3368914.1 SRPBCC family protein [Brevundimonas sp.]MDP3657516.1 SRPBCC family protein [Brevundimonas sp.]MDZ4111425.1 SRPBCC family protein [Brevundimonas sp.]
MFKTILAGLATALISTSATAEVTARAETSFSLSFERPVTASAEAVLEAVGHPAAWWSDAHTYSGSAANIRLDLTPGGCWCEDLPGGGVKHAETILVMPERRMVRFDAPFGPLQSIGADAVLTMSWADAGEGPGRTLKWTYVVRGPGAGAMADAIDGVLSEQFGRLADHLGGE